MSKLFTAELYRTVTAALYNLYLKEYKEIPLDVKMSVQDAPASCIYSGSSEVQRINISRTLK